MAVKQQKQKLSEDTKTIITAIALCTAYPVGLILMWIWTDWKRWVKWLLTVPIIMVILFFAFFITIFIRNASKPFVYQQCIKSCERSPRQRECINKCERKVFQEPPDYVR